MMTANPEHDSHAGFLNNFRKSFERGTCTVCVEDGHYKISFKQSEDREGRFFKLTIRQPKFSSKDKKFFQSMVVLHRNSEEPLMRKLIEAVIRHLETDAVLHQLSGMGKKGCQKPQDLSRR